MAYSYALPIAYEINTFKLVEGTSRNPTGYKGDESASKDISKRCQIMGCAIDNAYEHIAGLEGARVNDTLKIFMAPEFFFRGTEGAYPIEKVSEVMPAMRAHVSNAKFADWLFVFGTALGRIDTGGSSEIFNVAFAQKGGIAEPDGTHDVIVYKEFISSIDFAGPEFAQHARWEDVANRTAFVGDGDRTIVPTLGSRDVGTQGAAPRGSGTEHTTRSNIGGNAIFSMDGITFGLEVCRDHLVGRLKASPPSDDEDDDVEKRRRVQIHLITSAGAFIKPANVVCVPGGFAFNVDGGEKSDVQQCLIGSFLKVKQAKAPAVSTLSGTAWWTVTHAKYFDHYGSIRAYERCRVPPPSIA